MRWKRALGITIPAAMIIIGASTPAFASTDSGTLFTKDGNPGGKGSFDADAAGHPGQERLNVCDLQKDGFGVVAKFTPTDGSSRTLFWRDSNATDPCKTALGNFFPEEKDIFVQVCLFRNGDDNQFCSKQVIARA